ncbi:MAG TPA: hypothetical protein ENO23_07785, partial [Alphaproteobacteria bacterium]|nr:hypothetical protein [Alphaproteobacteria bacterium]
MKRFLTALLTVCLAGPLVAAPGEWHVYLDASIANRLHAAGDTLWCCTNGGILVFDLRDSTFTQLADGLSLPSNDVSSVVLDETGSLWAGFLGGFVARIDDPNGPEPFVKRYGASDGMLADSVSALEIVGDDIYYGSSNGVAKFFENFHSREPGLTDALEGVQINDLLSVHPDTLWIATESGIVRFVRPTLSLDVFDVGKTNALCTFDGRVRAAGVGGVRRFTGDAWEAMPGDLGGREAAAIAAGGGELVAVTAEGAWRWNGSLFAAIDIGGMKNLHNDVYRMGWNNILRAVAVDDNGTPWVGGVYTPQLRGVYVSAWTDGEWRNHAPNGPPHNASALGGLDAAAGGGVWLSTEKNGVGYRDPDGTWNNYTLMRFDDPGNDRLLSYRFNNLAILYDTRGFLWLNAQNYDLDMIRVGDPRSKADDEWAHFPLGGAITSNRYVAAAEDPAGNRWFLSDATLFESGLWGIDVADPDTSDWFAINPIVESRMGSGAVFGCAFDGDDRVYLALRGFGIQLWITQGFGWDELTDLSNDIW